MPDRSRPGAEATEADLQAHLAEMEAEAMADDFVRDNPEEDAALEADLHRLQAELEALRARLSVIKEQSAAVVRNSLEWADRSAHDQLGDYPWLKLAGAMAGTYVFGRMLRNAPVAAILTAVVPFVLSKAEK
jgi:hypothetical protein